MSKIKWFSMIFFLLCLMAVELVAGSSNIYPRTKAMETLSRGLITELGGELENAAVLDFVNLDGTVTMLGKHIAEEMSTRLAKWGDFKVIERKLIDKVIAEQKYSLSEFIDTEKAVSIGKLVGAQGIVIGTITELEKSFQVNARIIQTETGEVLSTAQVEIRKDADTVKLAHQVITPRMEKKVVKEPEEKVEKSVVEKKPESEEKIFYFEDFSEVNEGELPSNWYGGEKLAVKKEGRYKFLDQLEKVNHKVEISKINFPEDWKIEYLMSFKGGFKWICRTGNLTVQLFGNMFGNDASINGVRVDECLRKYAGKMVRVQIEKKGKKFKLIIDNEQIALTRKEDFEKTNNMIFEVIQDYGGADVKIYSIKGIDLTETRK